VNFESWGSGLYVQEADTPLQSLSWAGETLTFNFLVNGTGTLVLSCGSYGVPTSVSGMTGAYNSATAVLTGQYSSVSSVVVSWATSGPGPGSGPGNTGVSVTLSSQNLGTVTAGEENETATLTFTFTGSNFNAESVTFTGTGAEYVTAMGLPITFYGGQGQITVELNIPAGVASGTYTLTCTLTGLDVNGVQHQVTGTVSFTVAGSSSSGVSVPSGTWAFVAITIIISLVIVGALSVMTKRRI
jgi:hypothetical protein